MGSKEYPIICGGDMGSPDTSNKKSILNTSHERHKSDKSVKIVEPTSYVCEKKIKEFRLKVDALIIEQIERRKDEFYELKTSVLPSKFRKFLYWLLRLLLLLLLFSMIKASICHSRSCYCEVFWYESVLAGVFGIFATTYKDDYPS